MNEHIENKLRHCKTLPTLPAIALKVIELANDPDINLEDVCKYITLDPALSAKILKIANSPLYRSRREATNLRQAISVLGTHTITVIALSFTLANSFIKHSTNNSKAIDHLFFWKRAIASALACRALGEKLGLRFQDDLFLAGLMQDIGILVFFAIMPEEYESIFSATDDHDTLLNNERQAFGTGHDELGHAFLKLWNIPDYIALSCMASHCQPGPEAVSTPGLHSCTAVSRYLAEYFLTPNKPGKLNNLIKTAQAWLNIDADVLGEVIDTMKEGLSSVEDLFEVTILEPAKISQIIDEAKELLALQTIAKVRELEEKTHRDSLTGAMNRKFFDDTIQREFHISLRHQLPLTIAMLDIDHFKKINDTYGHITGDEILTSFSRIVINQIREDDIFCRYGGEEFALILPGTPLNAARNVTTRLKDAITKNIHKTDDGHEIRISASFGVASCLNGTPHFEKAIDLIKAADTALLAAKKAGRNRIIEWKQS
ncbi:MAG: GGDEF domain-containing protein [Nitrosomonas sp.]|nr:GGDEF domain-containing protein [Nitrosomonas sp.]